MNSYQPSGTPAAGPIFAACMFAHVIGVVFFSFFLPLVDGVQGWKDMLEKEGIVLRAVKHSRGSVC